MFNFKELVELLPINSLIVSSLNNSVSFANTVEYMD